MILVGCGTSGPAIEVINRCPPEPPEIVCPIVDTTDPTTLGELRAALADSRYAAGVCRALADAWLEAWEGC